MIDKLKSVGSCDVYAVMQWQQVYGEKCGKSLCLFKDETAKDKFFFGVHVKL